MKMLMEEPNPTEGEGYEGDLEVALVVMLALLALSAFAAVPAKISYQGVLTTTPVSLVADGNYDLALFAVRCRDRRHRAVDGNADRGRGRRRV